MTKDQLTSSVPYKDNSTTKIINQKQRKKQQTTDEEILTGNNLLAATQNQLIVGVRQSSQLLNDNFTVFNPVALNNDQKQKLNKVFFF